MSSSTRELMNRIRKGVGVAFPHDRVQPGDHRVQPRRAGLGAAPRSPGLIRVAAGPSGVRDVRGLGAGILVGGSLRRERTGRSRSGCALCCHSSAPCLTTPRTVRAPCRADGARAAVARLVAGRRAPLDFGRGQQWSP
jgi:hypothetical protein